MLLAAIVAHFAYHAPPDVLGAARSLREQLAGDWQFPIHTSMAILTVLVMWFAAAGLGQAVIYRFDATYCFTSLWSQWVFGALIGWVLLSLMILALGVLGFCNRTALGTLLVIVAAVGLWGWSELGHDIANYYRLGEGNDERPATAVNADPLEEVPGSLSAPAREGDFTAWGSSRASNFATAIILALYAILIPYAATPATESDELRYHLAAPEAYLEAGRIQYLPHQAFSNFPFLVEMLFTMAMSLQGTEGAKLIHLTFLESSAVLTALLALLFIRFFVSGSASSLFHRNDAARWTGLSFALIPCAAILSCWAFVDMAVVAYFLAVVYLCAMALVQHEPPPAWLMGLLIGGALGAKYSMLPLMIAMLVLLALLAWIRSAWIQKKLVDTPSLSDSVEDEEFSIRPELSPVGVLFYGLFGLAFAAPWYLKNLAWTGNPLYPLAHSIFGGADWSAENAQFYAFKASEKGMPSEAFQQIAANAGLPFDWISGLAGKVLAFVASPITTSLYGGYFESHYLGPIPLIAMAAFAAGAILIWATCRDVRNTELRRMMNFHRLLLVLWIGGVILGSWLFWFLTYQSNRFLLPTLALVIAVGGCGAFALLRQAATESAGRAIKIILLLASGYTFLYSASTIIGSPQREVIFWGGKWELGGERLGRPFGVALGFEQPDDYLGRRLEYFSAAKALNERLAPGHHALLIGEHRTLYFGEGIIASDWFDTPQPVGLLRKTETNDELLDRLLKDGVKYLFFNRQELNRYADAYFIPRMTPMEFARFDALVGFRNSPPDRRLKTIYQDNRYDIRIFEIAEQKK